MGQCLVDIPSKVWHIEMDGNCLFRALSYMLVGEKRKYNTICQQLCNFLESDNPQMMRFTELNENGKPLMRYAQKSDILIDLHLG